MSVTSEEVPDESASDISSAEISEVSVTSEEVPDASVSDISSAEISEVSPVEISGVIPDEESEPVSEAPSEGSSVTSGRDETPPS